MIPSIRLYKIWTLPAIAAAVLIPCKIAAAAKKSAADGVGMPQLNPDHFSSQLFWLFISFALMYWMMHRFALPHIRTIIDRRERTIQDNLKEAADLRSQAEDIKIKFDKSLREADEDARKYLEKSEEKLTARMAKRLDEANRTIQKKIQDAEDDIAAVKDEALDDIDSAADALSDILIKRLLNPDQPIEAAND